MMIMGSMWLLLSAVQSTAAGRANGGGNAEAVEGAAIKFTVDQ